MDTKAIQNDMTVYSVDGKKLGKILRQGDDDLLVEKGLFFKKDYLIDYDDIDRVEGNKVWLRLSQDQLEADRVEEREAIEEAEESAPGRAIRDERRSDQDEGMRAASTEAEPPVVVVVEEEIIEIASDEDLDKDPTSRR